MSLIIVSPSLSLSFLCFLFLSLFSLLHSIPFLLHFSSCVPYTFGQKSLGFFLSLSLSLCFHLQFSIALRFKQAQFLSLSLSLSLSFCSFAWPQPVAFDLVLLIWDCLHWTQIEILTESVVRYLNLFLLFYCCCFFLLSFLASSFCLFLQFSNILFQTEKCWTFFGCCSRGWCCWRCRCRWWCCLFVCSGGFVCLNYCWNGTPQTPNPNVVYL